ncbi:ribosomal protein S5 domain 2-type protein [Crepidotus variabilis]|uniref:Ribosomal RNA-processing protein 42 n=1 Tax=Crepidotus variabilis TaxID=179855 RepID=A0A9P6JMF1_9AGAR|nr:ribosomal protein S5 domain 2-type protein [Crepidotus variabilis]
MASISKAEKSYIQAGLLADPPSRADGRSKNVFRTISLETGVAPLANGSARLSIGRNPHDGSGGTEVLAATKLEVEDIGPGSQGLDSGRIECTVSCSPAAYPFLSSNALDELQYDYTTIMSSTLTHPSLRPSNISILQGKKSWLLHLDVVVLTDSGNAFDAMFMAARAALCDTKVPRTRAVEYRASDSKLKGKTSSGGIMGAVLDASSSKDMDVDVDVMESSSFNTRVHSKATDFELPDYWDEGEILDGKGRWPICITLNIVSATHFLDATTPEEASVSSRLLLMFSFPSDSSTSKSQLYGMRTLGSGEFSVSQLSDLLKEGESYAKEVWKALNSQLDEETALKLKEMKRF